MLFQFRSNKRIKIVGSENCLCTLGKILLVIVQGVGTPGLSGDMLNRLVLFTIYRFFIGITNIGIVVAVVSRIFRTFIYKSSLIMVEVPETPMGVSRILSV